MNNTVSILAPKQKRDDNTILVMAWDMEIVKRYAVKKGNYTAEEINDVEREYKRYLILAFSNSKMVLPISKKLDDLWHAHILFTEDYSNMCMTVNGRYLHHRPSIVDGGVMSASQFDETTLEIYREFFGDPDSRYWISSNDCRPCETDPNE